MDKVAPEPGFKIPVKIVWIRRHCVCEGWVLSSWEVCLELPGVICNREQEGCSRLWIGFPLEALLIPSMDLQMCHMRPLPWAGCWDIAILNLVLARQ